jgi:Tol biopolymer transport system component
VLKYTGGLVFIASVLIAAALMVGQITPSRQLAFTAYDRHETNALMLMDVGRSLVVRYPFSQVITQFHWMPDGETLLLTAADGIFLSLYEWRGGNFYPRELLGDRSFYYLPAPDFTHAVFAQIEETETRLNVNLYVAGEERAITRFSDVEVVPVDWSPDGTKLAYQVLSSVDPSELHVYDFEKGESSFFARRVQSFDWSPDGRTIAYTTTARSSYPGSNALILYDVASGSIRELEIPEPYDKLNLAWSPCNCLLSFTMGDDIYLIDIESGLWRRVSDAHLYSYYPVWSHDGKSLVYFAGSGVMSLYFIPDVHQPESRLLFQNVQATLPAWRP